MLRYRKIIIFFSLLYYIFTINLAMADDNIMKLTSTAFQDNSLIPEKYTCDQNDLSPPVKWQEVPEKTVSLVLTMGDPDAPMRTWDHWVIYNIPASVNELAEDLNQLPTGAQYGKNSWGRQAYGGPCPPSGTHRYIFKLYALDIQLNLPDGADIKTIEQAMQGHILATAQLLGRYQRQK